MKDIIKELKKDINETLRSSFEKIYDKDCYCLIDNREENISKYNENKVTILPMYKGKKY